MTPPLKSISHVTDIRWMTFAECVIVIAIGARLVYRSVLVMQSSGKGKIVSTGQQAQRICRGCHPSSSSFERCVVQKIASPPFRTERSTRRRAVRISNSQRTGIPGVERPNSSALRITKTLRRNPCVHHDGTRSVSVHTHVCSTHEC